MTLIPLYRGLNIVKVGNGKRTNFWLDNWLDRKPLSTQYPALFSHVRHHNVTVVDCFSSNGWQIRVGHITSDRADNEMTSLLERLSHLTLTEEEDARFMRLDPGKGFKVKACYQAMNFGGVICKGNSEV
jgi:hypothetical protein